jgi:hypothetical protein
MARGGECLLFDQERAAIERQLVVHDEQLAAVSKRRYLAALDRLRRFENSTKKSPIPDVKEMV